MRTIKFYFTICCLLLSPTLYSQEKASFSIMSYNIRNGVGMDDVADYSRTAAVIKKWHPDLIAVQEIDSVTNRSKQKFVIDEIASLTGMYHEFAPAINYDGGKYGIGILSKEKPLKVRHLSLPGSEEMRVLLIAEFKDYIFVCVHLSLTAEDQATSINIINDEINKFDKPVFIAGDFNAEPKSKTILLLENDFKILTPLGAKTYPANEPTEAIDYIAICKSKSEKYKLESTFVVDEPHASDHRPIMVEMSVVNK